MWVGWRAEIRGGKKTKLPYDPATGALAQSDNPKSWATLGEAEAWAIANDGNVGLMFAPIGGLHTGGIDLDTCRNPETGEIEPWAQEIIDRLKTYAEISPSQTGVKLFFTYALAKKPEIDRLFEDKHGRAFKKGDGEHPRAVEVYIGKRYFAVTEDEIGDHGFIRQVSVDDLRWLITDAGPRLARKNGASKGAGDGADNSRSARAFRKMIELKAGGLLYEQARGALLADADPRTSEWARTKGLADGERELRRAYENARPNHKNHARAWADPLFHDLADLQHKTFPPLKYIVPRLIVEGLTLVAGRPKIGKSWMALDIAIAVATGGTCLGQQ
jgi:hypothetical protein